MTDSRRDFLKTSSTLAAVGAVAQLGLARTAHAGEENEIKIGLVGCGGRGSRACVQALSTEGPVKLVAIGDAFRDQLDKSLERIEKATAKDDSAVIDVPEERKFVGFDAYEKVIASGVDVVILATPPGFRPIHFAAAVEAGKHVFMEKPVATDAPGVRKVLEAAKKAKEKNLKVGVGLQRRHRNSYLDMLGQLKDGVIGDLQFMRVFWNGGGVWEPRKTREEVATEMEYQMRNWYYYTWLCGDQICEQHIHNIDVGNWVMSMLKGEKHPVSAIGMGGREVRKAKRYGEIYDHHSVEFTFADGTKMLSQGRHIRNCWNSVSEHLHGDKGVMNLTDSGKNSLEFKDGKKERWRGKIDDAYQVEHDDLFAAIRSDAEYSEAEYGALSTMTAILGRMATYGGKEVKWEDAINSEINLMPETYAWDANPRIVPDGDGVYPVPVPGVTKVV